MLSQKRDNALPESSDKPSLKPLIWVGSSKEDLIDFPVPVRKEVGYALYLAQIGMRAIKAKPMRGFGGAGILEVFEDHDGNTFRAVYTIKFAGVVFVLHAFQKKSKKRIATPKADIDLIKGRLKTAAQEHRRLYGDEKP
jgi:phage-related protein